MRCVRVERGAIEAARVANRVERVAIEFRRQELLARDRIGA